jgi:hypothetical protein
MVKKTHKWRHRHQSVLHTHKQDTDTKVCYILKNKDAATKVFQILTSGDTATKICQLLTSEDTDTKVCYILTNKSPPPKCSRYSKWKPYHSLASHVHLTVYLSTCRPARLKRADYNGCRLNMLSFFLIGPKRQIVDATNSGWLPAFNHTFSADVMYRKRRKC